MKQIILFLLLLTGFYSVSFAQNIQNNPGSNHGNKFEQLGAFCLLPMNTERQAVHPAQSTGSNVPIMISNVNWMKRI